MPSLLQYMPRGSELRTIVYTPVCLCQEHHVSLFLSKGDLQCQLVRLLVSGCAERPFVSASLPAGTQKAAPDFWEWETASRRREGEKRESLICAPVDSATRWVRQRRYQGGEQWRQRHIETSSLKMWECGGNVWSEVDRRVSDSAVQRERPHFFLY